MRRHHGALGNTMPVCCNAAGPCDATPVDTRESIETRGHRAIGYVSLPERLTLGLDAGG